MTIECRCVNSGDNLPNRIRWFDPTNARLRGVGNTPPGDPYFTANNNVRPAILVIPTFSDSTSGIYTCGTGISYPPPCNVTINLMLTAGNGYFYYN